MNKTIQEERIRGYFLAAAKDLIRGEGVAVVTARNVAERAGYSYATLYNYFKDIRDLIFCCVEDFMQECREFVQSELKADLSANDRILSIAKGYAKFFVQYPGIFELFFQHKPSAISTKNSNFQSICGLFDSLTEESWVALAGDDGVFRDAALSAGKMHSLTLHGLLFFYVNRRKAIEYKELMGEVERITESALIRGIPPISFVSPESGNGTQ
jgi:AcrR family transcriptional regulator